ncbi:MAG: hypothetical protein IIA14_11490 [SAR324 cluster bacterium]|nr:hypothetical protein [SAR324 cluster bacterium]
MPKFLNIIKGRGSRGDVQHMLSNLTQKTPWVQVEVENTNIRFISRLSLGSGGVLMTKPKPLDKKFLQTEGWIRISPIPATSEELRLQITAPNFGSAAPYQFLCKIPGAVTAISKRNEVRWDTNHFKNFLLAVSAHSFPYRIMDLSRSGIMIRLREGTKTQLFPIEKPVIRPLILVGGKKKTQVPLETAIPRFHSLLGVGMEITIPQDGKSGEILEAILKVLEKKEREKFFDFQDSSSDANGSDSGETPEKGGEDSEKADGGM